MSTVGSTGTPGDLPGAPAWVVRAVGDVNGAGYADIVVQNPGTGQIAYGNMSGGVLQGWIHVTTTPGLQVLTVEDINHDGTQDIVVGDAAGSPVAYANMIGGLFNNWGAIAGTPGWTGHTGLDASGAAAAAALDDAAADVPAPVRMFDPGPPAEDVVTPVSMFDPGPAAADVPMPVRMFDPGPATEIAPQSSLPVGSSLGLR